MNEAEIYIRPMEAYQKIKVADSSKMPVYIYGVSGAGKTSFVHHYLDKENYYYITCQKGFLEENILSLENEKIIVVDDISFLNNRNDQNKILFLLKQKSVWLILIGRGKPAPWLMPALASETFMIISEQDVCFSKDEMKRYADAYLLKIPKSDIKELHRLSRGLPLVMKFVSYNLNKEQEYDVQINEIIKKEYCDYLQYHVLCQWDPKNLDFCIKLSIVDSFSIELAQFLTQEEKIFSFIEYIETIGNFLDYSMQQYSFDFVLRDCLHHMLETNYTKQEINDLYNRIGQYYETKQMYYDALKMYKYSANYDSISKILMKNAEKNPADGQYFSLRRYYFDLPEKYICQSSILMSGMSMLYSLLLKPYESEKWYKILENYERKERGLHKKEAKSQLIYLDIALPHRGSIEIQTILKLAYSMLKSRQIRLPEFSVTSNLPSLMNGGKDFCEWSKKDSELARTIGKMVEKVLGGYGHGLVSLALAESYYTKGQDIEYIEEFIYKGRNQAENHGKLEMCFVALGLLSRISIVNHCVENQFEIIDDFQKNVENQQELQLINNIEALRCRMALYTDHISIMKEWLKNAPKEDIEFNIMERYRYLTKVRLYIVEESYTKAISLLYRLEYYAKNYNRIYVFMEVMLLKSIIEYRMNRKQWKKTFENVLFKAQEYHFVRLISEEGSAVYPLLKAQSFPKIEQNFLNQVISETEKIAHYYPSYLKTVKQDGIHLSKNALLILKLQSEGMSGSQIAEILHIKEETVRYHCKQNYKKLGARGKAEAIKIAMQKGMI